MGAWIMIGLLIFPAIFFYMIISSIIDDLFRRK